MQKRGILLLLTVLLALALCACGGERDGGPAAETVAPIEPTPVQTPSPSPAPTPEPVTEIVLKNDNLPDDLQLTEYVACTNTNTRAQTYLDTGLSPTNDTTFIFDFACTSGFQTKDTWFFGCFDRDRVGFDEQGIGQRNHSLIDFRCFFNVAALISGHQILQYLTADIGQHGNNAGSAYRGERQQQSVVTAVNSEIGRQQTEQFRNLGYIAGRFLNRHNIFEIFGNTGYRRRRDIRRGTSGNIV